MDTVPDKVLICSQQKEGRALNPFYSNRQMRQFYAEDFVKEKTKKQRKDAYNAGEKKPSRITLPIFKPI